MKPKYFLLGSRTGSSLSSLATITISLAGSAFASSWVGDKSTDWNDDLNWAGNSGTGGADASINITPPVNIATIFSDFTSGTPVDILVGNGIGKNGRLIHTDGTVSTGTGNWLVVGRNGGNGIYDMGDPSGNTGTLTGLNTGSGSMTVGGTSIDQGRLYIGSSPNSTGVVNVNTSGSLIVRDYLVMGNDGGNGTFNFDAGTITTGGWNFMGSGGDNAGTSTFRQSGGSFSNIGERNYVGFANSVGRATISGGVFRNNKAGNNTFFAVGVKNLAHGEASELTVNGSGRLNTNRILSIGGISTQGHGNEDQEFLGGGRGNMTVAGDGEVNVSGEFWVGEGTGSMGNLQLTSGSVDVHSWVSIGRSGGTGSVVVDGGTLTKRGGGNFIVGASGSGTLTQNGGLINVVTGVTWVGETGGATTAEFTLNGGEFRTPELIISPGGVAPNAVANLNGGTALLGKIMGGSGTDTVNFNGTQINATGDQSNYIEELSTANVSTGGILINTAGFNIASAQNFTGSGGLVKSGAGTLTLTGSNAYTGDSNVSEGRLNINGSLDSAATNVTGGSIGGTGTVGGILSVGALATLEPGMSIGTLSTASTILDGKLVVEYDGTGAGTIDLLNSTGMLDIDGSTVDFSMLGTPADDEFYIFAKYGALTGTFGTVTNLPAEYAINYNFFDGLSSNNIALVIPEPTAVSLVGLGALGLLRRRRK